MSQKERKEQVMGNWRKGDSCSNGAENFTELNSAGRKADL